MSAKDRYLLNKQQATQAEDEDVLGYFVTSPHHVGFEAGGFGLVFMQEQQRLHWGGSALDILSRGHRFITGSCRVLQQGQETPTAPPEQPHNPYPREVAE